jgi:hypothetical protein
LDSKFLQRGCGKRGRNFKSTALVQETPETTLTTQKNPDFLERRNAAQEARKALLDKFRAAPGPDDPEFAKRQAERQAIHEARLARTAEREAAKRAREAELAAAAAGEAERAAVAAREAERLSAEEAARRAAEEVERRAALEADQKAKRDARYAARQAAKKRRRRGL